jgi:hypothetical protein
MERIPRSCTTTNEEEEGEVVEKEKKIKDV